MSNKEIIQGFIDNDKKIVLIAYKKLFPKIKKWISSYHGDEDDARNTIWKAFAVFRQKSKQNDFQLDNFEGFIVKTVRYLWFQEIRKRRQDMMTHHLDYNKIQEDSAVVRNTMDIGLVNDQEEIIRQFQHQLKKLPISCQQLILLKYQYGLPHEDIAARYNTSTANTRKRLSRCLEKLAEVIEKGGFTEQFAQFYPGVITYIKKYLKEK